MATLTVTARRQVTFRKEVLNHLGIRPGSKIRTQNVVVDRPAIAAGLAVLDAGGDFADGVMAHDGQWLGGEIVVSFDEKAVALLGAAGCAARRIH